MRAYWHRIGGATVGSSDNGFTGEYKTLRNLVRFGLPADGAAYRAEIFLTDRIYGKPDRVAIVGGNGFYIE